MLQTKGDKLQPGQFRCFGRVVSPPQTSIHPRVVNGRTIHPKKCTSAPRRKQQKGGE